jgi:hypothetical protein
MRPVPHRLNHAIEEGGAVMSEADAPVLEGEEQRRLGAALFNRVWTMLETPDRTREQDEWMIDAAHASALHWRESGMARPENHARSAWQISRVYAVTGRGEPALHHARRCLEICEENGIGDFDLAFAHEAMARAHWVAGDHDEARRYAALAQESGAAIEEDDDREIFQADLATLPVR